MPHEVTGAAASAGCVLDEGASHANAGAPYLVTRGLVKGYGEGAARMEVLRGIDVEIARGEICVLLGPSGSGKSTFLNLIEVTAHLSKNPLPIDDLLKSLGLYDHRAKFPRQVSGGQQQRCAIGRALVKNPGLLLCDEPTGALDYKTSKEILALMEQVNRDYGCTIVIVTHNDAISRMANRVLRLRDGMLVENEMNAAPVSAAELVW